MTTALLAVLVSLTWVLVYRSNQVVIAAQPPFLYVLFLGSAILAFIILVSSFDESYGWDETMLSMACVSIPWMACLGKGRHLTHGVSFEINVDADHSTDFR